MVKFSDIRARWIRVGMLSIVLTVLMESCERIPEFSILYPFINQTNDTIFLYEDIYLNSSYILNAEECISHYHLIKTILPQEDIQLSIPRYDVYRYGDTGVSQIMVFRQSTLESHTLKEIADSNIYDALYIFPWTEMVAPGFEIRYDGESHWLEIQNPKRPN